MTKIEYDVTDAANRKLNLSYLVLPTVYSNYDSDSYGNLWFHDTGTLNNYLSLYLVEVQDMNNPSTYNPILALDQGLWVEKDVQTYGALFSSTDPGKPAGGGAINLGHGYTGTLAPPSINLVDSGLINLILDSEVFGIADSYWSGYGGNKNNITSGFLSPDKVNYTAQKIDTSVAGGCTGCYQSVSPSLSAGQSYTVSVWLKGASGGESLKIGLNDSYESSSITLQTSWVRYSFTATPTVGHTDRGMQFRCLTANAVYYVWGAQLQTGSNLTSYAKTTTGASSPFDTLFLYKADGTSANLDLGNLTVHGSLTVSQ
ncbi:MAG TPA: hypothetical protein VLU95_00335, partial [Candidatus Acidoferrum sp.]|nr:hypothetical protein [Candidatus Acidoferrum sp.]